MDTKIGGTRSTRSGQTRQHDPARVWAPLGNLAEAAERVSRSRTIAIARGFDRNSRQRARALRELLEDRGIASIEVTSAPGNEQLLDGTEVAAVTNLLAAGSWQPYRLAAKLRVPMLTPKPSEDDPCAEVKQDIVGMSWDDDSRDVALSHVEVRPVDPETSNLVITTGDEPLSLPGGRIIVVLEQRQLAVRVSAPGYAERSLQLPRVHVETSEGPYRLVRDELPIADFDGAVGFTAETEGLAVRPV